MSSVTPQDIGQACESVRAAVETQNRLTSNGAGTKRTRVPISDSEHLLCTGLLTRVVEFSPADLTITVEAGVALRNLDALLAPHNLRLPLDPPDYDGRATLGGVLATNDSGPLRLAHGTAREHVIGMSMVLADGTLIKSGGKVVKNVAGYDLHRLFVGSCGSLGLIATVSLKLKPRAESMRFVTLQPESLAQAEEWTAALLRGPTRPAILDWLSPSLSLVREFLLAPSHSRIHSPEPDSIQILVGYEDNRAAVDWQVQRTCKDFPAAVATDEDASATIHARLRERASDGTRFCARVPSSRVAQCFELASTATLHAHAASGVIHGHSPAPDDAVMDRLREFVLSCGGFLTVTNADGAVQWFRAIDPTAQALERRLKQQLDPAGVFPMPPFLSQ